MKRLFQNHSISATAPLITTALFALCILCVLLAGAGVYRRVVSDGQESYGRRTGLQYVSTKIRQCEDGGALSVETFGDVTALTLQETVEGEAYVTRVYCYDGWLMELFSTADGEFAPEDGEQLIAASSMDFAMKDGLLLVTLGDEAGREDRLTFALRGGEEAAL